MSSLPVAAGPAVEPAPEERRAWAAQAARDLSAALDRALGERFRLEAKRPRDGAGWIDVTAFDLELACPARWSVPGQDDFAPTARTVAGALGRLALRERRDGEPVGAAVDRVLQALDDVDRDAVWFADWYEDALDRSSRAVVRAAATTWATGALAAVGGRRLAWSVRREKANVDGRTVQLRGGWDAADRPARPAVLLVMSGRHPDDPLVPLVAGFNALVCGLPRREVPSRVRIGSAATARTTVVRVTPDLLSSAVRRVAELAALRADPDGAAAQPGRHCRGCHVLESCAEGSAHEARRQPSGDG